MLVVIVGKDYAARERARKVAAEGLLPTLVEASDSLVSDLAEKAGGASLFGEKSAYLVRAILGGWDDLAEILPALAQSDNIFIFEEESLLKAQKDAVKNAGGEVIEGKTEKTVERSFNLFALADALGARDRKKLWLLLTNALREGHEPEEIAGVLHWGARSMLAARGAHSAESAGMKSFTYAKAKKQAMNFTPKELTALSRRLVTLYHEGHRGDDMALLLEQFALSL